MKGVLAAALTLVVAGVALVALSVSEGGATVALVVIFPVVFGSSGLFLLGVVLMLAGLVSLPFALAASATVGEEGPVPEGVEAAVGGGASGGVVLIGPVPILFGSWRGLSRRERWALVLLGAGLLTVVWLAFVGVLR